MIHHASKGGVNEPPLGPRPPAPKGMNPKIDFESKQSVWEEEKELKDKILKFETKTGTRLNSQTMTTIEWCQKRLKKEGDLCRIPGTDMVLIKKKNSIELLDSDTEEYKQYVIK